MITKVNTNNSEKYNELFKKATELMQNIFKDVAGYKPEDFTIETIYQYYAKIPAIFEAIDRSPLSDAEKLQEKKSYTILPLDEAYFEVNADTRKIIVPEKLKSIGVVGDQTAEIVYFLIDRYFDAIDFGSSSITAVIEWKRTGSNPDSGITKAWIKELKLHPNKVYIGWPIERTIAEEAGTIEFALRLFKTNNKGEVDYSFSTQSATVTINKTLNLYSEEGIEVDDYSDLILNRITSTDFSYVDGSNELKPPIFVINVGDDKDVYIPYTNNTYYADLDTGILESRVFAKSQEGTNNIQYQWQRYVNGQWLGDLNGSIAYVKETSLTPIAGKKYYSFEGGLYVEESEVTEAMLQNPEHNIFYEVNQLEVNGVGIYRCKVIDKVGIISNKEIYSAIFYVLGPEQPKVKTTQNGQDFMPVLLENPEEGVKLKILGGYDANGAFYHSDYDINTKTNLNYQWFAKDSYGEIGVEDEPIYISEDDKDVEFKATEENYYYAQAITTRNGKPEYSKEYTTYRVTNPPQTFGLNKCSQDGFSSGSTAALGSQLKILLDESVPSDALTYTWYKADNTFESTEEVQVGDTITTSNRIIELNTKGMKNGYYRVKVVNTYNTFDSEEFYLPTPNPDGSRNAFAISG